MKVVVLGKNSESTKILVDALQSNNHEVKFIEEHRSDKYNLIFKRVGRMGFFTVFGQLLFLVLVAFLRRMETSRKRVEELSVEYDLAEIQLGKFENINSIEVYSLIESCRPNIIVLSGTRILTKEFLEKFTLPIVNVHVGITPKYRGVHGGYWSLVSRDINNFGSTIHRVDEGIDTGGVLAYAFCKPLDVDNFVTYPLVQVREAAKHLPLVLEKLIDGGEIERTTELESKMWSHPTIFQYIYNRLINNVK